MRVLLIMFLASLLVAEDTLPSFTSIYIANMWIDHGAELLIIGIVVLFVIVYAVREKRLKNRFESLLSGIGDGVYGIDEKGRCIWINDQALEMLGYTEAEVMGQDTHTLFHHHTTTDRLYPSEECPIHQTLQDQQIRHEDDFFIRHDGTLFPVSITVAPSNHHAAIVVFKDITERQAIENALKRSEERFRLLVENMHSGVAVYRPTEDGNDFVFQQINPAVSRIDGVSPDEVIGRGVGEVFPGAEEMGIMHVFRRVHRTGIAEHFPTRFYQDGRISGWRENYIYKISTGEIVAIYDDVSERMMLERNLEKANRELKEKNRQLQELAMSDGLTHIPNRRLFDEIFEKTYREALREAKSLAVLMIDVDNFKAYNDHYGHQAGDEVLIQIAAALKSTLHRPSDIVARYGGEEFTVLLKDIDCLGAEKVADALMQGVMDLHIVHAYSDAGNCVSISIGIAIKKIHSATSQEDLLKYADKALYEAKRQGRNRFHVIGC